MYGCIGGDWISVLKEKVARTIATLDDLENPNNQIKISGQIIDLMDILLLLLGMEQKLSVTGQQLSGQEIDSLSICT